MLSIAFIPLSSFKSPHEHGGTPCKDWESHHATSPEAVTRTPCVVAPIMILSVRVTPQIGMDNKGHGLQAEKLELDKGLKQLTLRQ